MNMSVRKVFGNSLEAILDAAKTSTEDLDIHHKKEFKQMMLDHLVPGKFQPRRDIDPSSLKGLSDSIAAQGVLQPILVRKGYVGKYEIIAGERRWQAAQMAGLQQVPVIVCDISDESALAFGLIENIQRQDLNPIEEAFALKRLIEEFEMTHEQVANSIGYSRATVSNALRLLNLTPYVQELLIKKELDVGHAKILLSFSADEQNEIASILIEKKLTVRDAEELVRSRKVNSAKKKPSARFHPKCREWSSELSQRLSSKVDVMLNKAGEGKVVIYVSSEEKVEYLVESLGNNNS